jgi:hypothetical protein
VLLIIELLYVLVSFLDKLIFGFDFLLQILYVGGVLLYLGQELLLLLIAQESLLIFLL